VTVLFFGLTGTRGCSCETQEFCATGSSTLVEQEGLKIVTERFEEHHFPEILKLKKVIISDKNVLMTKIVFIHPMHASLREIPTCEHFFNEWRHWLFFKK
jgi:hypothetical protein